MAGDIPKEAAQLDEFEKSQDALRRSIEESKRLADKSQQIIDRHRASGDGGPGGK